MKSTPENPEGAAKPTSEATLAAAHCSTVNEAKKLHRAVRGILDVSYKSGGKWPADVQAEIYKLTEAYNAFGEYLNQLNND